MLRITIMKMCKCKQSSYNTIKMKDLFEGVNDYSNTLSLLPGRDQIEEIRNLELKDVPSNSPLLPHNYDKLIKSIEQFTDKTAI